MLHGRYSVLLLGNLGTIETKCSSPSPFSELASQIEGKKRQRQEQMNEVWFDIADYVTQKRDAPNRKSLTI